MIAELLAKYLHEVNSTKYTDNQLNQLVMQGIELFRCIKSHDIFEGFYRQELSRRILSNHPRSTEVEKLIVGKIAAECGQNFVK